jgi:hypothetical protein
MLLGQNLSRPSNFSPSPSLREAHSRPASCLSLLQPITVGPAIGPVAIATGSTPPRSRPPRCPCDMSMPPRAHPPCQTRATPRRPHRPRGASPPPPRAGLVFHMELGPKNRRKIFAIGDRTQSKVNQSLTASNNFEIGSLACT